MSDLQNRIRRHLNGELSSAKDLLCESVRSLDQAAERERALVAKVERLRKLVRDSYLEGHAEGRTRHRVSGLHAEDAFDKSLAAEALAQHESKEASDDQ